MSKMPLKHDFATGNKVAEKIKSDEIDGSFDKNYVHQQTSGSNIWNVNHQLQKVPSVVITDDSGEIIFGSVSIININTIKIQFSTALTGFAYCN